MLGQEIHGTSLRTHEGQKLGNNIMDNIFPCLTLYHKRYVQDQPYTEEIQIPRDQVHTHALKTVNPVYLPTLNSHSHCVSGKVLVFFFLSFSSFFKKAKRVHKWL